MYNLLKWFSVFLFISMPLLIVAAIWFGDLRYFWIGLVTGLFSAFAGGYADNIDVAKRFNDKHDQPSLF